LKAPICLERFLRGVPKAFGIEVER